MVTKNNYHTIVLDIGARYGIHPSWKNFSGENIMLLVEADNFEAERLKKRYKNFHNVKIYNQAIGDANGYKSLRILKNPTMSGFFKRTKNSPLFWGQRKYQEKLIAKKKVKFETLKNFLKKIKYKIDFIKMDVEGSELDILKHPGNLFSSLLALRSEVNFVDTFHDKQTKKKKLYGGNFGDLNKILNKQGFKLLNIEYNGKGDCFSKFISSNQKYGMLQNTDAIWIKDPIKFLKEKDPNKIIKMIAFLFSNNASDFALWLLENTYKKHRTFKSLKHSKILRFAQILCLKHFYNLKWLPNQKIKEHKLFYEKVFNSKYPEMNKFNESLELNPL